MALNLTCTDNPCEHPGGHRQDKVDERFILASQALNDAPVPTTDRYVLRPDGTIEGPITL